MLTLNKVFSESTKSLQSIRHEVVPKSYFTNLNQASFKNMLKYLNSLKKHNVISDEEFVELVTYSCGIFVENEIEKRFSKVLKEKILGNFETSQY